MSKTHKAIWVSPETKSIVKKYAKRPRLREDHFVGRLLEAYDEIYPKMQAIMQHVEFEDEKALLHFALDALITKLE